jgi:hypothetical protein
MSTKAQRDEVARRIRVDQTRRRWAEQDMHRLAVLPIRIRREQEARRRLRAKLRAGAWTPRRRAWAAPSVNWADGAAHH